MPAIEPKWRDHHYTRLNVVELTLTRWVHRFYGSDVSSRADLMDGTLVDLDTFWSNLRKEGLYEPLLFRVGVQDRRMRLEAGNHRIQVFNTHDVPYVPLTVQVRRTCGPERDDTYTDAERVYDGSDHITLDHGTSDGLIAPSRALRTLKRVPGPVEVPIVADTN